MELNPEKVIYYPSQSSFLVNMHDDKVSVKLFVQAIIESKLKLYLFLH